MARTPPSFENSVNVKGLRTLEDLLAGPGPLKGLASPKWPSVFPALDQGKVARGAALYQQHCQSCHLPPLPDLLTDLEAAYRDGPPPKHWWKNALGNWFINVTDIGIEEIGTDPHEATDFNGRTADTGDLKKGVVSAREGLDLVTRGIANRFFEANKDPPEEHAAWAGGRDPRDVAVRDDLIYKARPLNGIWAVAPFLHNGSVPNLYLLLSPRSERPDKFWTGSKQFDPVHGGLRPGRDQRRHALRHLQARQQQRRPRIQGWPPRQRGDRAAAVAGRPHGDHRIPQVDVGHATEHMMRMTLVRVALLSAGLSGAGVWSSAAGPTC